MAFNIGSAVATIKADISQFQAAMATVGKELDANTTRIQGAANGVQTFFDKYGAIAAAASAAVGAALVKQGLDAAGQYEQQQIAFTTLLKDREKALVAIKNIEQDAKSTPYNLPDLIRANQLLVSAGVNTVDARDQIKALGNAIAATGGGTAELNRLSVNMQQIRAVGKATALDIKQFAYAGINIYQLLADSTGKSIAQVKDMDVTYDVLVKSLQKASDAGGRFEGAMANQSHSLQGLKSNLEDVVNLTLKDIVMQSGLFDATKNVVLALTQFAADAGPGVVAAIKNMISGVKSLVDFYDKFHIAINIVAGLLTAFFIPALIVTTAELIKQNAILAYQSIRNFVLWGVEGWKVVAMLTAKATTLVANTAIMIANTAVLAAQTIATFAATAATWALNAALIVLTSPITLIILGIIALGLAIYLLIKNWGTIGPMLKKGLDTVVQSLASVGQAIVGFFAGILIQIIAFGQSVATALAPVGAIFQWLYSNIIEPIMLLIVAIVLRGFNNMLLNIIDIANFIVNAINTYLVQPAILLFTWLNTQINMALSFLYNSVVVPVVTAIATFLSATWTAIVAAATALWDWLVNGVILPYLNLLLTQIVGVWTFIANTTAAIWSAIAGFIGAGMKQGSDLVKSVGQGISDFIHGLWNGFVSFFVGIGDSIKNAITQPFNDALHTIEDIGNKIKKAAEAINPYTRHSPSLVDNVQNGVADIIDAYKSLKEVTIPAVSNMLTSQMPSSALVGVPSAPGGGGIHLTINLDGAIIADELGAQRISESIGNNIIKKLQSNLRF